MNRRRRNSENMTNAVFSALLADLKAEGKTGLIRWLSAPRISDSSPSRPAPFYRRTNREWAEGVIRSNLAVTVKDGYIQQLWNGLKRKKKEMNVTSIRKPPPKRRIKAEGPWSYDLTFISEYPYPPKRFFITNKSYGFSTMGGLGGASPVDDLPSRFSLRYPLMGDFSLDLQNIVDWIKEAGIHAKEAYQ